MDLKLPGMLGSANLPEVTIHLLHADTAFATPISHCGDVEHEGKVDQFANYAFEVVPSAHIDIATFEEKGLKKATLGATEPTDTICLLFKAIGSCRKSMHCTLLSRDGEVPSQKELSSYFEELLVVKFLVKRNLVPQMRNFSPTLSKPTSRNRKTRKRILVFVLPFPLQL